MAVQTIVNGNVSEAEDMVAQMTSSSIFITRLQQAGLGVVHVLLVSCEPLDPEELPVRLRPLPYNVTFPMQGELFAAAGYTGLENQRGCSAAAPGAQTCFASPVCAALSSRRYCDV